jgi:hypothetical protein
MEFLGLRLALAHTRTFSWRFEDPAATQPNDPWKRFEAETPGPFDALYRFFGARDAETQRSPLTCPQVALA